MDQVKGKVCVTGASGFLASWLVKRLLLSGYNVIGTVRDPGLFPYFFYCLMLYSLAFIFNLSSYKSSVHEAGNEKKLAHLWRLEGAKERLKLVRAELLEEGSFDDAIMGCHGVFHTASPVIKPSFDPKACSSIFGLMNF